MKNLSWMLLIMALLWGLSTSVFIVHEGQTAVVLHVGRVARSNLEPGLHVKIPLLETARVIDRRFQAIETLPASYFSAEQKDVSVDFWVVGQVTDPARFLRATMGSERDAFARLIPIITDTLRNRMNAHSLRELVGQDQRDLVMQSLTSINQAIQALGVQIIDLRVKQWIFPADSQMLAEIYERMRTQRHLVAARIRADGDEQAQIIRAHADREASIILAQAQRDAQTVRGQGEAQAAQIYNQTTALDPEFYAFYRTMDAYRQAFGQGNTIILMDKDAPFLRYFRNPP